MDLCLQSGSCDKPGACVLEAGTNFCLHSENATAVELLLFATADADAPEIVIPLDPEQNRTGDRWHVLVPNIKAGQCYGYRVRGPFAPTRGHRYHPRKLLLDPRSKAISGLDTYRRNAAANPRAKLGAALKSVVVGNDYDWRGDVKPATPWNDTLIYEMHVGGFTKHPNSGVASRKRGTYAGLVEKIPYLQDLGITAVELLPIHVFDPGDAPPGRTNYWGYSTIGFFAPHPDFAAAEDPLKVLDEFRDMVRALHAAGIEVILDVVYNHTAEGNAAGPTLNLRGIDNQAYYHIDHRGRYRDFSGCGNSLDASKTAAQDLVLESLRYWADEMHIDGFRFDLASVLCRGGDGLPQDDPPLIRKIEKDPSLSKCKLIAEAWDAAGLYQVGAFPSDRFADWNGPFRDDMRQFIKGDGGSIVKTAMRMTGSIDLYRDARPPRSRTIHFITCHDGFTLADLVSYNVKHNEANGEGNRDGTSQNHSWNCGAEGPTDDPKILTLRRRQARNLLTVLLLADGCPMLNMGDEVLRTQQGNNNAYCQDNELSWFDWDQVKANADMLAFVRGLNEIVKGNGERRWNRRGHNSKKLGMPQLRCFSPELHSLSNDSDQHRFVCLWHDSRSGEMLCMLANTRWEPRNFNLPEAGANSPWRVAIDTEKDGTEAVPENGRLIKETGLEIPGRTIVVLSAR